MRMRIALALTGLLLFVALPSLANLYTEWLWFGEVGYQSIFLKSLTTKGLISSAGFLIAFVVLYANLRFAITEIHRPYVLFAGGGDLKPLVLERPAGAKWWELVGHERAGGLSVNREEE